MQETFSDEKNKIKFISEFQKGFYTLCKRIDPEDPIEFVTNQLARIFYATHNISKMDNFGENYYSGDNTYQFTIYDFERDISFIYALSNYIDIGSYDKGFAFDCDLMIKDMETPKEFMIDGMHNSNMHTRLYDEDFDTKDRVFYATIINDEDDILYFPIRVSKRQATMNLYGLSKMISLAALFILQSIYMSLTVCATEGLTVTKKQFYKLTFEMGNINNDPESMIYFKNWLNMTDVCDIIKYELPSLDRQSLLCNIPNQEKNKELTFTTLSDQTKDDDENISEDDGWKMINKTPSSKKAGTTVAIKLPNDMEDSPISEINRFLGNLLGIDLDEDTIDINDEEDDEEDDKPYSHNLTFEDIVNFIDVMDNEINFIDLPISEMSGIIKEMRTFLMTPREERRLISSPLKLQEIYESSNVICMRAAKSESDTCTFVLSGGNGKYKMYKCTIPPSINKIVKSYPVIGIVSSNTSFTLELRKSNIQQALRNIADIDDFHDDCIRLIMAYIGSHATKKANTINPYSGADKDNNIIIQNANFTSIMNAFEKVDCFNNDAEIDAAIRLIKKESNKNEFICPWMKEIKDIENSPLIIDTDGMAYAYETNGKEFTKLMYKRVVPSSPFHTDMSFHISKGRKSITAKGPYLSTSGFKTDIISIFNYLKQLKKMD